MNAFRGDRLKHARLYRGLTVGEIAERIGVTKQTISQYENGKIYPTCDNILLLVKELDFPYDYFFQNDCINVEQKTVYFRSLLKTSKKYRVEQCEKICHLAKIFAFLDEYVSFPKLNIPSGKIQSPAEAARMLRELWGLGNGPITDLLRITEENGLIVTTLSTSTDDIDAYSQLITINGEERYLIVLSSSKSAVRRNFDIAHELGHILLHDWSEDIESLSREQFKQREDEANQFAAEFLLPRDSFINSVSKYYASSIDYYKTLKEKWHVSMGAMMIRSCRLGIITQNQYQYMMRIMQKNGWRKKEPLDDVLKKVEPSFLYIAIRLLFDNNVFNERSFMEELSSSAIAMSSNEVEKLLGLPEGILAIPSDDISKQYLKLRDL